LPSTPPESAKPAAPSEAAAEAAKPADDTAKNGLAKGQAYWSGRRKGLLSTIEHDKVLVDAVQSRINALTADFSSRADPIQRAGVERDRLQALAELSRLQKEIKDTQKELSDFDEEARKAGVPPGWLR
jgi:seryl-tRNA synthetase